MAKKPKKKPKYNANAQNRSALRRVFSRSPIVQAVKQKVRSEHPQYNKDGSLAKKPAVRYKCSACGKLFKGTEIAADHVIPVVDIDESFVDWNEFIKRLWCNEDGLQMLCSYKLKYNHLHDNVTSCHNLKTAEERKARALCKLSKTPSEN